MVAWGLSHRGITNGLTDALLFNMEAVLIFSIQNNTAIDILVHECPCLWLFP